MVSGIAPVLLRSLPHGTVRTLEEPSRRLRLARYPAFRDHGRDGHQHIATLSPLPLALQARAVHLEK